MQAISAYLLYLALYCRLLGSCSFRDNTFRTQTHLYILQFLHVVAYQREPVLPGLPRAISRNGHRQRLGVLAHNDIGFAAHEETSRFRNGPSPFSKARLYILHVVTGYRDSQRSIWRHHLFKYFRLLSFISYNRLTSLLAVMLNHLINDVGFVWGVRAAAFITLGCFILGNALIFVPRKAITSSPTCGVSPQPVDSVKTPLWDTPYLLTLVSAFVLNLGTTTPTFYVQLFAQTKGVNSTFVFNSLAIMNAANIIGSIVPNWFADKLGAINVYIPLAATVGKCTEFPEMVLLMQIKPSFKGLMEFAMLGAGDPVGLVLFSLWYVIRSLSLLQLIHTPQLRVFTWVHHRPVLTYDCQPQPSRHRHGETNGDCFGTYRRRNVNWTSHHRCYSRERLCMVESYRILVSE